MQNNYRITFKRGCLIEYIDILMLAEDFTQCVSPVSHLLSRFISVDNSGKGRSVYVANDEISIISPL